MSKWETFKADEAFAKVFLSKELSKPPSIPETMIKLALPHGCCGCCSESSSAERVLGSLTKMTRISFPDDFQSLDAVMNRKSIHGSPLW